jgi:hypothetical protein
MARAYVAIACFVAVADVVNVTSTLYDVRRMGHALPLWAPVTWEFTSGAAILASCWTVWLALTRATPGIAPWRRVLPVHALTFVAFSAMHTGLMTLLRMAVYAIRGLRYPVPPPGDVFYESRKDIVVYLILIATFWVFCRPAQKTAGAAPEPASDTTTTFDIVDGPSLLRAPIAAILAVRAAGNYVEFVLDDGRRPLMRARLAEIETSLSPHGFLRTHRSWLVNPARLVRLEAVGSGDYRLMLGDGAEASLSRRFPQALERLKRAGA